MQNQPIRRLRRLAGGFERELRAHFGPPPILIYQMGKTGGESVNRSLNRSRIGNAIYHVHTLVPRNIRRLQTEYADAGQANTNRSRHLVDSQRLAIRLKNTDKKLFVITAVREPIARAVSHLFQKADWRYPDLFVDGVINAERVLDFLATELTPSGDLVDWALTWFQEDLEPALGVDVYAKPFDHMRGYMELEGNGAKVLVYRLTDMSKIFPRVIADFLGVSAPIHLVGANIGSTKPYAPQYGEVLDRLTISKDVCQEIYSSKLVRHFYTERMIDCFVARWTRQNSKKLESTSLP